MMLPYRYLPRPGEEIDVCRDSDSRCAVTVIKERLGTSVRISADEVPAVAAGIAAAMHEAAGLPAPVILERPEIDPEGAAGVNVFTVGLDRDLSVCVSYGKQKPIPVAPSVARKLASVIAAYADAAEAARRAPDPAEVEELAYILRAVTPGMAYPGEGDYKLAVARGFAEAALKWMREREAAGG